MTEWTDSAEVALLTVPDLSQFQPAAQRPDVYLQTAACSRRIPVDRNHPKEKGRLQKVWKINTITITHLGSASKQLDIVQTKLSRAHLKMSG